MPRWGLGDAAYKRKFGSTCTFERDVCLFAPGPRGLWLNGIRAGVAWSARCAKSLVEKLRLKDRLRKLMRRSAQKDAAAAEVPASDDAKD